MMEQRLLFENMRWLKRSQKGALTGLNFVKTSFWFCVKQF